MNDIKFPDTLDKIIDLCRKKGVQTIKIQGIELTLREEAPLSNYKRKVEITSSPDKSEKPLTEEDWLLWSVDQTTPEEATHA